MCTDQTFSRSALGGKRSSKRGTINGGIWFPEAVLDLNSWLSHRKISRRWKRILSPVFFLFFYLVRKCRREETKILHSFDFYFLAKQENENLKFLFFSFSGIFYESSRRSFFFPQMKRRAVAVSTFDLKISWQRDLQNGEWWRCRSERKSFNRRWLWPM